jgi:hypothetical protein
MPDSWIHQIKQDKGRFNFISEVAQDELDPLLFHLYRTQLYYSEFSLERLLEDGTLTPHGFSQRQLISTMIRSIEPPISKQRSRFPGIDELLWPLLYERHLHTFVDSANQSFEFNKIRDLINGNYILFKKGRSDSEKCSFCDCPEQTNSHLFQTCPIITQFWNQVQSNFFEVTGHIRHEEKALRRIQLSNPRNPGLIATNRILMLSCQIIHNNNIVKKLPSVSQLAKKLIQLYYKENVYFSTRTKKQWFHFVDIWVPLAKCIDKVIPFSISEELPKPLLSAATRIRTENLQVFLSERQDVTTSDEH